MKSQFTAFKIDRSFMRALATGDHTAELRTTLVSMGRSLGLAVVAEGVETTEQLDFLQQIGCATGQEYLSMPAVTSDRATELLHLDRHSTGPAAPTENDRRDRQRHWTQSQLDPWKTFAMPPVRDLSILVAGATGGLGAPISRLLAAAGARLTLIGRDRGRLEALELDAALVAADLRLAATATRAVSAALEAYGELDGLIVASGAVAFGPVSELTDEVLLDLFALNTLAPIRLVRAALPALTSAAIAGRKPFAVHLSAIVAENPAAGMAAYSASKGALTAFDAAAGRELRRAGIRLVDARPPHTETGLAARPLAGAAPRLARGLDPDAVAARVLAAVVGDERDLPSSAFS